MTSHAYHSHLRRLAQEASGSAMHLRIGQVTSFDPSSYTAKVMLQPDQVETDWLPIVLPWAGNTWGLWCAPSKDDQVVVGFEAGDVESGVVLGIIYSDVAAPPPPGSPPPTAPQQGEFWLVHKAGAFVRLTNDGKVTVSDKQGSTVVMNGDGTGTATFTGGLTIAANTTIQGTLHVTQDVTVDTKLTATNDVIGGGKHLATHTHSGVQTGGGNTGGPN